MKKGSSTLRRQITLLTTILMVLQSMALVASLLFSNIFLMLDLEAFKIFKSTSEVRAEVINDELTSLIKHTVKEVDLLNESIKTIANKARVKPINIYRDDDVYERVALRCGDVAIKLMNNNYITGAFVFFEGSNARKDLLSAHSAVYIRDSRPDSRIGLSNYQLEIGPVSIIKQNRITSSINWNLDANFVNISDSRYDFYSKPMVAATMVDKPVTEQYGYWAKPSDILNDKVNVITYTVPLLDDAGTPYALFGVEIQENFFIKRYLIGSEMPYDNSFYMISSKEENKIDLSWNISDKPVSKVYFRGIDELELKPVGIMDLYEATLTDMPNLYCTNENLMMYGRSAIFVNDVWTLSSFAPEKELRASSTRIKDTMLLSIALSTFASFLTNLFASKIFVRKITELSKYISGLQGGYDRIDRRTGFMEIDQLIDEANKLTKRVNASSKITSKILEMTSLPIGGFEVRDDSNEVMITNYICKLLDLNNFNNRINLDVWIQRYKELTCKPVPDFEDTYEYLDRAGDIKYLRIVVNIKNNDADDQSVGVILDVTEDVQEKRKLAHELDHDGLTQLYNREAFKRKVYALIKANPDKIGAMLFSDLDNLKYINDNFGHDLGDVLIKTAAAMFSEFDELMEINPMTKLSRYQVIVARISGDEFAVYIHGYDSQDELRQRVLDKLADIKNYTITTPDKEERKVRFSTGIAWYPYDAEDTIDLIKLADYAMYEIKHSNKGGIAEFNKESYDKNSYILENSEKINVLLDESQINFAFQPIVDLNTGEVYAYEMLMRPTTEDFKSPLEIIAVATSQSKLGRLERLVFFVAFSCIRANEHLLKDKKLFINSIPSQILSVEDISGIKSKYSDLFDKVVIELTEAEGNSPEHMKEKTDALREMGFKLAIDDFGAGHSNETRILSIVPDIIKIDMDMVQGVSNDRNKAVLICNLLAFCKARGAKVVAEGVENAEDLEMIIRMGVDYVQGFYTGRPNFEVMDIKDEVKKEIIYIKENSSPINLSYIKPINKDN